ncbi:MAG: hypothetical protein ABEJ57_08040 [Halobacteriaceae archaeon]
MVDPVAAWPLVVFPLLAVAVGVAVYLDATTRGRDRVVAALAGTAIGGVFLAGSVPSLVALAVTDAPATQGFPTALRVIPGFAALAVYLVLR